MMLNAEKNHEEMHESLSSNTTKNGCDSSNDGDEYDYSLNQSELVTRQLFPMTNYNHLAECSFVSDNRISSVSVSEVQPQKQVVAKKSRRGPRSRSSQYRGVYLGGFDTLHYNYYFTGLLWACGVSGEENITKKSWEKTIDSQRPGQGLIPTSFKVKTMAIKGKIEESEDVLDPDFGKSAKVFATTGASSSDIGHKASFQSKDPRANTTSMYGGLYLQIWCLFKVLGIMQVYNYAGGFLAWRFVIKMVVEGQNSCIAIAMFAIAKLVFH